MNNVGYDTSSKPLEQYTALQDAFDWLNRDLFHGELLQAVIVFHRKKGAKGYFWSGMWHDKANNSAVDEIALVPELLDRSDMEVLSTLAHEMVHQWQFAFGKPSRSGYHNREWADMMIEIGLHPTTDGTALGKETGQKCTHYIIANDRFHQSAERFLTDRKVVNWIGLPVAKKESKAKNKVKYTCSCGNNVWGKAGLNIVCSECEESYVNE